jgi:hypothetical protein
MLKILYQFLRDLRLFLVLLTVLGPKAARGSLIFLLNNLELFQVNCGFGTFGKIGGGGLVLKKSL